MGGDGFLAGRIGAGLGALALLDGDGAVAVKPLEAAQFTGGESLGGAVLLEPCGCRVPAGLGQGAGARIEQRGGLRVKDGHDGLAGFDLGAGLQLDAAQQAGDRGRQHVTLSDAGLAFLVTRHPQTAYRS